MKGKKKKSKGEKAMPQPNVPVDKLYPKITVRYPKKSDLELEAAEMGMSPSAYINWIFDNRKKLGKPPGQRKLLMD